MLVGVNWLFWIAHRCWDVIDWGFIHLWIFFVFLFSSLSLSPYSPQPSDMRTCMMSSHAFLLLPRTFFFPCFSSSIALIFLISTPPPPVLVLLQRREVAAGVSRVLQVKNQQIITFKRFPGGLWSEQKMHNE